VSYQSGNRRCSVAEYIVAYTEYRVRHHHYHPHQPSADLRFFFFFFSRALPLPGQLARDRRSIGSQSQHFAHDRHPPSTKITIYKRIARQRAKIHDTKVLRVYVGRSITISTYNYTYIYVHIYIYIYTFFLYYLFISV